MNDMKREMRLLFLRTNTLLDFFSMCCIEIKKFLWLTFINGFHGANIWPLCTGIKFV